MFAAMALMKNKTKIAINLTATKASNSFKFTSSLLIKESVQTPSPLKASVRITILIIERTNSIGVLKTLGADNNQIRAIFINYTLLIIIPGLIVGNLIGIGLLLIQKYFGIIKLNPKEYYISTVPVDLNLGYILALSLGILVVSAISLIVPSYLISRISPAKVVKYN